MTKMQFYSKFWLSQFETDDNFELMIFFLKFLLSMVPLSFNCFLINKVLRWSWEPPKKHFTAYCDHPGVSG